MKNPFAAAGADFKAAFEDDPFHRYLGLTLVEQRDGYGQIELLKTSSTPSGVGRSVHGGVLATMIDMVALVALFAKLRDGEQPAGTADLSIAYLRQAQGSRIVATGEVLKRGRQLAVVDVRVTDDQDRLCCLGKVTYAFRSS
ncbi:MAG: PaaI family thioesterase [Pseudomonadota bacterium]